MATGRIHNFAFFLLTFYFLKLINQFESILQNKPNLLNAQMNVTSFYTVDYENNNTFRLPENKANQTQPVVSLPNLFQRKKNVDIPEASKWQILRNEGRRNAGSQSAKCYSLSATLSGRLQSIF